MVETTGAAWEAIIEVPTPAFTGLSFKLNQKVNALKEARDLAVILESGLDTQVKIRKTSVELRDSLIAAFHELHAVYANVLVVRENLLDSVGEVAAENKKSALAAKIAADQISLAAM